MFNIFLVSNLVSAYQALLPALYDAGAFAGRCSPTVEPPGCRAQNAALGLMYDLGVASVNFCALPWGLFVRYAGPRWSVAVASMLFSLGALFMAISGPHLELWTPGYILLGAPAGGIIFPAFSLLSHYPQASHGMCQAYLAGSIEASSAVFYGFQLLARAVPLSHIFWIYAALPLLLGAATIFISFAPAEGSLIAEDEENNKECKECKERKV